MDQKISCSCTVSLGSGVLLASYLSFCLNASVTTSETDENPSSQLSFSSTMDRESWVLALKYFLSETLFDNDNLRNGYFSSFFRSSSAFAF